MIANIDVLVDDRIVVDFRDVGVRLVEKSDKEINQQISLPGVINSNQLLMKSLFKTLPMAP